MAPRPTVIGSRVIGVDLPAFLLSKNFYSESIGMSRTAALRPPQLIAIGPLSGGTYRAALRSLAFQLCLPHLLLRFSFRVVERCDLLRNSLAEPHHPLTRHRLHRRL